MKTILVDNPISIIIIKRCGMLFNDSIATALQKANLISTTQARRIDRQQAKRLDEEKAAVIKGALLKEDRDADYEAELAQSGRRR
ncbi:MAG: hypothetical protein V1799_07690 [bacterium]